MTRAIATWPNRSGCIPRKEELKTPMKEGGFGHVDYHNMTGASPPLHVGIMC